MEEITINRPQSSEEGEAQILVSKTTSSSNSTSECNSNSTSNPNSMANQPESQQDDLPPNAKTTDKTTLNSRNEEQDNRTSQEIRDLRDIGVLPSDRQRPSLLLNSLMVPEEIAGDYEIEIHVKDFRIVQRAEYKVVVKISFFSSRTRTHGSTSWHIWRPFHTFRKLDEQLRKRNHTHMKGIKFPPLYRRRRIFRLHLNPDFLETRMRELDTYMQMVTKSPPIVNFHVMSIQCQSLKAFIGYISGFGSNPYYEPPSRASNSGQPRGIEENARNSLRVPNPYTTSVCIPDDEDEFRSVDSGYSYASSTFSTSTMQSENYRWARSGFRGSHKQPQNRYFQPRAQRHSHNSLRQVKSTPAVIRTEPQNPVPPNPVLEMQRAKMEEKLLNLNLAGVGMPADGSCLLHCLVYEMYPLQCLKGYSSKMSVVNLGAADGTAPRRIEAAQQLRRTLMEYAITYVKELSEFLMHPVEELETRYRTFMNTPDEQATINELYAAASMFNIEIMLVTNDPTFTIDPVRPVKGLPSVRNGEMKSITFGYMIPEDGLSGHYICTRDKNSFHGSNYNMFAGGSYRGSISVGPPARSMRCGGYSGHLDIVPEQPVG